MCLFCPSFNDYVGSWRSNFDPKSVQMHLGINFRTWPKMVTRCSQGGPQMLVPCSQPESYCSSGTCWSSRIMTVCKDHDRLQASCSSTGIMIVSQQHHSPSKSLPGALVLTNCLYGHRINKYTYIYIYIYICMCEYRYHRALHFRASGH